MSFGTELQQNQSHRALLQLQDVEIQILEVIKKCLHQRIKSDRDYANSLSLVLNLAQKIDPGPVNTPLLQVWNTIMKETEGLISLLRDNLEKMSVSALDKIMHVINSKKSSRKFYHDERLRLNNEFEKLKEDANKLKTEYEKTVNKQIQERLKYDDLFLKGVTGKKVDDAKSRVTKACVKLHRVHNDYICALHEVTLYQQHYMNTMLPDLLIYQQEIQQSLIVQCKTVLTEYAQLSNCSNPSYTKHFQAICDCVNTINPSTEYSDFIQNNRSDALPRSTFEFDVDLLQGYKGSLQVNQLAVDNLTIDQIQHSKAKLGDLLQECEQKLSTKQVQLDTQKDQLAKTAGSNMNDMQKNSYNVHKRAVLDLDREINELHCKESIFKEMRSRYEDSLAELGGDTPPLGVRFEEPEASPWSERESKPEVVNSEETTEDMVAENGNASSTNDSLSPGASKGLNMTSRFNNVFSKFKKQPNQTPPKPPSKDFPPTDQGYCDTEMSQGLPDRRTITEHISIHGNTAAVPEGYQQMVPNPGRKLDQEDWFHGVLPREDVQRLLATDGDYLVRESKNRKTGESQYVLSVFWSDHKHFIIQGCEGGWRFEGDQCPSIQELIASQHNSGMSVTRKSGAILQKAIIRETWEIRNDDIQMGQKIGNGNFGDVFRGHYQHQDVAIKTCKENLTEDAKKKFLQEGRILKQYDHPNIVKFIGIAAQRHPVMIVMEYVPGGALLTFLKKHGAQQTKKQLVKMCEDASGGMAYLEERSCIHRDLAARNCLVGKTNTVKISDFGMSREEEEYDVSGGLKQIPIKWTAPEALNYGKYTSACDVWSFGVLMWEIFSFGQSPYPGFTNSQAREKVDEGYRMPPPEGMPREVYELTRRTWEGESKNRPHFDQIRKDLQKIYKTLPFR